MGVRRGCDGVQVVNFVIANNQQVCGITVASARTSSAIKLREGCNKSVL